MNKLTLPTALLIWILIINPVFAQDESPESGDEGTVWENVVSVNGVPLFGEMIDQGVIHQNVDWMDATIMGQDVLDATYHVYTTTEGEMVYVPDAITLAYMAANPEDSGYQNASILANGEGVQIANAAALLSGSGQEYIDVINHPNLMNTLKDIWSAPDTFFPDIINGKSLAFTTLSQSFLNTTLELLKHSVTDWNFYTTLLVFENCASSPLGCPDQIDDIEVEPTPQPTLAPTPAPPRGCPASQVTTQAIEGSIELVEPEYPLVIGQDPQKRGADILASVTIPPIVHTYYDRVPVIEEVCENNPVTNVYECKNVIVNWRCEKRVKVYPDQIVAVTATASLTQESQSWIENNLSRSWYEAKVQQPNHNLIPGIAVPSTSCDYNQYCSLHQFVEKIPFVDPGNYSLSLSITTSGTPVSLPRQFYVDGVGKIWVTLTTLKEN